MSDAVLLDVTDGVATITMNRPDSRNALSAEVSDQLVEHLERVQDEGDARVVVITGQEGTFCAGGDVNAMAERMSGQAELYEAVRRIHRKTSRAVQALYECYLPTVAKVDGVAYGAGANLALAADIQLASRDAKVSFGFRQVGLAIDTGTSYFLPRVVGINKAKELVFTGELLDAEDALDLGLFCHVYDDDFEAEADDFIAELAAGPTVALETSKRALNQGLEAGIDQAMTREAAHQAAVFETYDHREGAEAFMAKRRPEFEGR